MAKVLRAYGMNKCIGCFTCMFTCAGVNKKDHSLEKSAIRVKTSGGMQSKFISMVCLACTDEIPCVEACPSEAITKRSGGGVNLDIDRCIGCKKCVDACVAGGVHFDDFDDKAIICKHCGVCARFCPHGCLTIEEV